MKTEAGRALIDELDLHRCPKCGVEIGTLTSMFVHLRHQEYPHLTDGTPCWCQPRVEHVLNSAGEDTEIVVHQDQQA